MRRRIFARILFSELKILLIMSNVNEMLMVIQVLIVDDMAKVRQDLRTLLKLSGQIDIVGEASNGLEAVAQVKELAPDVVLLDLEMPVMDGYEAAKQIKTCNPACWIVALTVHAYDEALQKALEAGVDSFIVKGAPIEVLVQEIIDSKEKNP
jgi:DNA-binding NarL/FixJ family response regulator